MATTAERFGDGFGGERMWGLRELPYPDAIPFVPETVGWLVIAGLLVLIGLWLGWRARRRWLANAYRREALVRLNALSQTGWHELPFILRKTALTMGGREAVASLRGAAWISWLNARVGRSLFESGDAELLDALAYGIQPPADIELERLLASSRAWVAHHHA